MEEINSDEPLLQLEYASNPTNLSTPVKIAVIGGGSFGTAMATVAARAGNSVLIFARDNDVVNSINQFHKHPKYLKEFELHPNIIASTSLEEVFNGASFAILALPVQTTPDWLSQHKEIIPPDLLLCNTAKGLYLKEGTLLSTAIKKAMGRDQPYALLSGPSFAKEIMLNHPTAVVVASQFLYHAVSIQRSLSSLFFRIYTSQDLIGVELGGALKNPLAIGAGCIEGMGLGINSMAAYVTRSSLELRHLCIAMGGRPETVSGLSGIGDLMLTAFGELSRNRSCGIRLTRGEVLRDITSSMTVEGVPTASVAVSFADRCGLELPIFRTVEMILNGQLTVQEARSQLMGRSLSKEFNHL